MLLSIFRYLSGSIWLDKAMPPNQVRSIEFQIQIIPFSDNNQINYNSAARKNENLNCSLYIIILTNLVSRSFQTHFSESESSAWVEVTMVSSYDITSSSAPSPLSHYLGKRLLRRGLVELDCYIFVVYREDFSLATTHVVNF